MQLDQELENMEGWHHLLNELQQMSRRDEKDLREGAIKKVAEMPRLMIEEHDELKIMLGAKPSCARDVVQLSRRTHGGGATSLSRGSTIGDIRLSRERLGGDHSGLTAIITSRRNGWPANVARTLAVHTTAYPRVFSVNRLVVNKDLNTLTISLVHIRRRDGLDWW
jgi:hypothetical protein